MFYKLDKRQAEDVSAAFPGIVAHVRAYFERNVNLLSVVTCREDEKSIWVPVLTFHRTFFPDLKPEKLVEMDTCPRS